MIKEKIKYVNVYLDESLRRSFRSKVIQDGKTIREIGVFFVEKYIKMHEDCDVIPFSSHYFEDCFCKNYGKRKMPKGKNKDKYTIAIKLNFEQYSKFTQIRKAWGFTAYSVILDFIKEYVESN